jgi:two-component system chemotaxis sensor kinase CheA
MVRRDEFLPLLSVRDALGVEGSRDRERMVVVVDTDANARIGLLVDELIGQRQVVLKSLEANYHGVPGVSGATILSDGRAALILDVPALHQLATPGAAITGPETAKMEYVQ